MIDTPLDYDSLTAALDEVEDLSKIIRKAESYWAPEISRVDATSAASARNLADYWGVRQRDLRDLQRQLARFGLSSIGRSEPHVQASLDVIANAAEALLEFGVGEPHRELSFDDGSRLLPRRAADLFGASAPERATRIMVTLPTDAATDPAVVRLLIAQGMDVARINCAHDRPEDWAAMAAHVRTANAEAGRQCRIAMDLAGPKVRTGPLVEGPRVVRLRPRRDALGRVIDPARFRLTASSDDAPSHPPGGGPCIPVPRAWLAELKPGDRIDLHDMRGAARRLRVESRGPGVAGISVSETTYLGTGTTLTAPGGRTADVGGLPAVAQFLTLRCGDELVLSGDCTPVPVGDDGPLRIGCTLPEVFNHVRVGELVHFDDGRISGRITAVTDGEATIRVIAAAAGGSRLRAGKGINLPETTLAIPALTPTDRSHLKFIADTADIVELSFARSVKDIDDLLGALDDIGAQHLGVVVKIETAQAFDNLPEILFELMRHPRVGVMIARGDLAVECGYERLAEVQEEILWLCEAAHLPVIWATEVLDRMARSGRPSRAEITDAAMGERAECVMLNKGPHIIHAVAALDDVLRRMSTHHAKRNELMRSLRSWAP